MTNFYCQPVRLSSDREQIRAEMTFVWLSSRNFFWGAKSIVMQISFVMLIFLLFSDQISGGKVSEGGKLPQEGAPCPPLCKKASLSPHQ